MLNIMWKDGSDSSGEGNRTFISKSGVCGYHEYPTVSNESLNQRNGGKSGKSKSKFSCKSQHLAYRKMTLIDVETFKWFLSHILVLLSMCMLAGGISPAHSYCGRKIVSAVQGTITDGPGLYPNRRSCEWLIKAPYDYQSLKITVNKLKMECNYDYLYIFDGGSHRSPLLASLSGFDAPNYLLSSSSQVLVVLQTDYGVEKDGFELSFQATDCPNECSGLGTCANGVCATCPASRKGSFCEEEWCPHNCNAVYGKGVCDTGEQKCSCNLGFAGESCSLPTASNTELNCWHTLSSKSHAFRPRSGHVAGYFMHSDSLWVFAGRSLNGVFDDTLLYNMTSNTWQSIFTPDNPVGRFKHAGDIFEHYLVVFGGETSNGTILNDLWLFDTVLRIWFQPSNHNSSSPPGVVGHTANIVNGTLYIFGGITKLSDFSTDIYAFNLKSMTGWKKVAVRGGKSAPFKFYGHTSVYSRYTKSLIIFGGEAATSEWKNSVKHRRLVSFNLEHLIWTELFPDQKSGQQLPLPVALHTAVIVGDYMVVYGGVVETATEDKCQSQELYYYNIKCNTWVDSSHLNATTTPPYLSRAPYAGRFSHSAAMRDDQTMLIVGGFNGVMFGDVMAFRFPQAVALKNSKGLIENGGHCNVYVEKNPCYADPACGWCFSNPLVCLPLNNASFCDKNFDGRFCSSHCSAYVSCDACILFGTSSNRSCSWCMQDQKCYDSSSPKGACSASNSKHYQGWWGASSKLFTDIDQCFTDYQPAGLTLARYTLPPNMDFPDKVTVATESKFDDSQRPLRKENVELTGSIYPYVLEGNPSTSYARKVSLTAVNLAARLYISSDQLESSKEEVASLPISFSVKTAVAASKSSGRLFPSPSKGASYFIQCALNSSVQIANRVVLIRWNLTDSSHLEKVIINSSFLRPYNNGNCKVHTTCMACIRDMACGWCTAVSSCILRTSWTDCKTVESQISFLATQQTMCFQCADIHDCFTCTADPLCSWSPSMKECTRKGVDSKAIVNSSFCPSPCFTWRSCSSCLANVNCRWCYEKHECFTASAHMSKYALGQCQIYQIRSSEVCRNCSAHTTCASCLLNHRCGWCGTVDNPLIGKCHNGDFAGPMYQANCSVILQANETVQWSYGSCPDADECRLKLDDCHGNATCYNTDGSYNCMCNRGYTGDGKVHCEKTCYHNCQHGYCGADYQCKCDLGWKGENCSIDCGCNGHSTCDSGIGICDACQNYTKGTFCDECLTGTYGDPRKPVGCQPCECNEHGIVDMGLCHSKTGKCFCKDQTHGDKCESCDNPLSGNARNGGICFNSCSRFSLIQSAYFGYLSMETPQFECLWVITYSNASSREILLKGQGIDSSTSITLNATRISLPCIDSHVFVYDGIPGRGKAKLLGVICGFDARIEIPLEAKSGIITVQYQGKKSMDALLLRFQLNRCDKSCHSNRHCVLGADGFSRCLCKRGWMGDDCQDEICPRNCSNMTNQGYCNERTGGCICKVGFGGMDCGKVLQSSQLHFQSLDCRNASVQSRYGQTFLPHGDEGILYGGRGLESEIHSDIWSINFQNQSCEKLKPNKEPTGRYFHCGVVYKDKMFIYGGKTKRGVSNEVLLFHFSNQTWTAITLRTFQPNITLPFMYSHTCTLVNDVIYVIGGFNQTKDGLSERILAIHVEFMTWDEVVVPTLVKGIYGHSAVFDNSTNNILVYGGIIFSNETVHESDFLYAFDVKRSTWNILQSYENMPFALYQHSAVLVNDIMFLIGGYSNAARRGYNQDVLIWKKKCNRWQKISNRNFLVSGSLYRPSIGQSAIVYNSSIYLFGGFHTHALSSIQKWTLPADICNLIIDERNCLVFTGCDWCQSNDTTNNGTCYDTKKTFPHACNNSGNSSAMTCASMIINQRNCTTFRSCFACFATFPGTSGSNCRWCIGRGCLDAGASCDPRSPTKQLQCLDYKCESSSCDACNYDKDCMWTRHFRYLSETSRVYSSSSTNHDWNCFRRSIQFSNDRTYPAKDKDRCPDRCSAHKTCSACLKSTGAEGGSRACYWSQQLRLCFSSSFKYVSCHNGECGLITKDLLTCPAGCDAKVGCNECIQMSRCGWCARPGLMGLGSCQDGGLQGPRTPNGCSQTSGNGTNNFWAPLICPNENECLNGKHNCNPLQYCIDTEDTFLCKCKKGYEAMNGACIPVCSQGCQRGTCVQPDVCSCDFGWTSHNCSVKCQCNGHSNCPNDTHADICIECQNNTQGSSCDECKASFVGNPGKNLPCVSCSTYCNGHATVCVQGSQAQALPTHIKKNLTLLLDYIGRGPVDPKNIECVNCLGNSEGPLCEKCLKGYFEKDAECKSCECNGHGSTCNGKTGAGCDCQQNTKSEEHIWSKQCNLCRGNFYGNPANGRQCFQRMSNDRSITIGNEKVDVGSDSTLEAIPPNRTMFFSVPPRYTNVDIKLNVDVVKGAVDIFITADETVFIVDVNYTSGEHYLASPRTEPRRVRRRSIESYGNLVEEVGARIRRQSPTVPTSTSRPRIISYPDNVIHVQENDISMYTEFKGGMLLIKGIQRRVIIGIKYEYIDFRKDRFYIGVITRGSQRSLNSAGYIYFRQDLSQIDLFVFFSVFFSVFFLILSFFFLSWKIKQLHHGRQVVMQQQIALETMASRPFAKYTVQCERNDPLAIYAKTHSELLEPTSSRNRKSSRRRQKALFPMSVEFTEDELAAIVTVFIQFPENNESLWNLSLGSAVVQATPQQVVHTTTNGNDPQKTTTRFLTTVNT